MNVSAVSQTNHEILLGLKEKKVSFQLATIQGPHWTSGNTSSIFHHSCHRSGIFSCISSTPGTCAAIYSLSQSPWSG